MAIHQLLHCIPKRFDGYGIIRTVPFIFALQEIAQVCIHGNQPISLDDRAGGPARTDSFLGSDRTPTGESEATGYVTATDGSDSNNVSDITTDDSIIPGVPFGGIDSHESPNEQHSDDSSQQTEIRSKKTSQQSAPARQTARQCLLAATTLDWMISVAEATCMDQLRDYLTLIKSTRQQGHQVSNVDLFAVPTTEARQEPEAHLRPVTEWMDRQKVVKAILDDGKLHDIKGTPGVNLEDKLYVKWGSEAYGKQQQNKRSRCKMYLLLTQLFFSSIDNQERSFRIETDTNTDMKPKLTPAITNTSLQVGSRGALAKGKLYSSLFIVFAEAGS